MAAPANGYAFDMKVAKGSAARWSKRSKFRTGFEEAARNSQYSKLDTPERLAKRANRLLDKLRQTSDPQAESLPAEDEAELLRELPVQRVTAKSAKNELLERIIGETRDFLFVDFLERSLNASKSVARIVTKLGGGRVSYGTGFMVSPRLLMTNHHVLTDAATASVSVAEFDYQKNLDGHSLAVRAFALDPVAFFLNDKGLDFAIVAVSPHGRGRSLAEYGWCPLHGEEGKILIGEPINIIQHPMGEAKQVVIRQNRLLDLPGQFAHYEADTEPGSSGSPVFNDQWEVVALHHSGVPKQDKNGDLVGRNGKKWSGDDPSTLAWVANEGIRVSQLVEFISRAQVRASERGYIDELLAAKEPPRLEFASSSVARALTGATINPDASAPRSGSGGGQTSILSIPLVLSVTFGRDQAMRAAATDSVQPETGDAPALILEKVEPDPSDPNYKRRPGYRSRFLGFEVPFPRLTLQTEPSAYAIPGLSGKGRHELKYHHFSILFNKSRRLAFVAGVNLDPTAPAQHQREGSDKWYFDPRVRPEETTQAGEPLYSKNPLDRGHLVRRADAAWGRTKKEARLANDDTFHFTNCSPQHEITNQGRTGQAPAGLKLWGKLEDHISSQGKSGRRKLTVFNGPVFRQNDRNYRGVQLPKEYWKVVVYPNDAGKPGAAAFVLTQAALIVGLKEEFEVGEYKAVQVKISDLEKRIGLDFGRTEGWDAARRVNTVESLSGEMSSLVLESILDVVL